MSDLPLAGRRVVVTRQESKARESSSAIAALGGEVLVLPSIDIDFVGPFPEFQAAVRAIESYDFVIVTSANTARALVEELRVQGSAYAGGEGCVAIGKATARALGEGGIAVGIMPEEAVSDRIAASLGELRGKRVLMPGSDLVRGVAAGDIRGLGAEVDEVVAYRTVAAKADPLLLAKIREGFDALVFTSPSTVRGFDAMTEGRYREGPGLVACIGPVTAEGAREVGYRVDLVPADHSMDGLVQSLVEYWREAPRHPAKGAMA